MVAVIQVGQRYDLPAMQAPFVAMTPRQRRLLKTTGGFVLLTVGVPLLFLPGPGGPAIVLGLSLLRAEYPWAERLLGHVHRQTERLQGVVRGRATAIAKVAASKKTTEVG
jgi:hypothetical protein